MRAFKELIGKEVTVYPYEYESFRAKVLGFEVEDYYFYEKNEEINVYVHVEPINFDDVDNEIENYRFSLSEIKSH